MRSFWILCLLLFGAVSCYGVEVSGYFEPQMGLGVVNDKFYQMNTNKLRVDLRYRPSDNLSFGANFDYIIYSGKTEWDVLDYIPKHLSESIPSEAKPYFRFRYRDRDFLDNAYLKLSFKRFDLTVGKQQISLGTGYAWNPTDIFNIKDMMDPTYEQPGHNALRLDVPIGLRYGFVLIYTPGEDWKGSGKLIRFKGKISHFDYSLILIDAKRRYTDYLRFVSLWERRRVLGGDFAGELLGLGVWGEFAYNRIEEREDFWEGVMGLDYTFEIGTHFMVELYHNTSCKSDYERYDLNDWMSFLSGRSRSLSRDLLYLLVDHPLTDLIGASCSMIVSLSDGSFALVPMLSYEIFEDMDLTLLGNLYIGREGKMFSGRLGNGLLIRARIYF